MQVVEVGKVVVQQEGFVGERAAFECEQVGTGSVRRCVECRVCDGVAIEEVDCGEESCFEVGG